MVTKGKGHGRGTEWEFGICKCKLLYIERIKSYCIAQELYSIFCDKFEKVMHTLLYSKQIAKKNLLYSTWNCTQCYVPA